MAQGLLFAEKQCFKCGHVLPLTEFYRHPQMADGRLGKCKECSKRDVRENRESKREYYSEYERERNLTPERREHLHRARKLHRQRNPEKARARYLIGKAVRSGELIRPPCQFCGNPQVQAHHHDYSKPFDVTWVCFKCHREKFHGQVVVSDHQTEEF